MLKVLVVEDDAEKLRRVVSLLREVPGVDFENVAEARSSHQARQLLLARGFDVLILDIHLPRHLHEEARPTEGLQLLEDIREGEGYNIPAHVIGLTGIPSVFADVSPLFAADLFAIVFYEASSPWRDMLRRKLEYIVRTTLPARSSQLDYGHEVAIVTALRKVELEAVLRLPWGWSESRYEGDPLCYWHGVLPNRESPIRIVAAAAPAMGMPATSVMCCRIIDLFRPHFLIMAGITAGISGRVDLGDVICADPTWDWGSGKYVVQDGQPNFLPAPYQIPLEPNLRSKVERLERDDRTLAGIRAGWPDAPPGTPLKLHIGPLASGAAVLADETMANGIQKHNRHLLGVEMETYAVYYAAFQATCPRPLPISVKGVCDFADPDKNDRYQSYAAYVSAQVVANLVESLLFPVPH